MVTTRSQKKNQSAGVYLRSLETTDLDALRHWHNNSELYDSLGGSFRYVSRTTEEEWLRKRMAASSLEVNLAICRSIDSTHIGNIYLRDIDWVSRRAELHIFIGEPDERGKGYGLAAMRLLIRHAFDDMGLRRIYLSLLEGNTAAVRLYKKCGFQVEGKLRAHIFKKGHWNDMLLMGLCADDPRPLN
jgi:RimJ/RimL family protein N-acetyltransferase